jgi:hypothetical protein
VDILPLSLAPNEPVTKIVRNTSSAGGLYRATLVHADLVLPDLAPLDSFPTDDVAVAFLSEQFVQRVLLYGEENYFLQHVLQAQPQTEIVPIETVPHSVPSDSVLLCHRTIPAMLPPGNVMVIDPQNDCNLFRLGERLEKPIAVSVDAESPLMRFTPPGLVFAGARNVMPQENTPQNNFYRLSVTADDFPLYLQFVTEDQRTLVLSADLNQGDFALRTAFPILVSQALNYFRRSEELQKSYSTAESVKLTVQTEKARVVLRSPSGREEVFPCSEGIVLLGRLGECGVWTVLEAESKRELARIACNLFSTMESDLRSVTEMSVSSEAESSALFVRPIWYYLVLFALFFTTLEWFLYQRRWIE